ncbi:MAG: hypothetical protein M3291_01760 [Actinomycetota bacterium]|nr:hypothetical protein [Actinomycetota bacterium]
MPENLVEERVRQASWPVAQGTPCRFGDLRILFSCASCCCPPPITDLLAAVGSGVDYRVANLARTEPEELPDLLAGVLVVVRLLGRRRGLRT